MLEIFLPLSDFPFQRKETHGHGRFIRKGAIDVVPADCDRRDLSGGRRSFTVVRRVIVVVVIRQEGGAGGGEDANEEGYSDGDDYLTEATAAEAGDHLVHLFPAKTTHYRYRLLRSSVSTVGTEKSE